MGRDIYAIVGWCNGAASWLCNERFCYTTYHFCFLSSPYFFGELVVLFRLVLHTVIQNS
jgi:hypothetical protein